MPKRKYDGTEIDSGAPKPEGDKPTVKNSLDSDEEEEDDESGAKYALDEEEIEGQEETGVTLEDGIQFTPFNMEEELEEGHFDKEGMYHWKKEKLAKDSWLENIDWIKIKEREGKQPQPGDQDDDDSMPEAVDVKALYRQMLTYMEPKESVAKTLKRLGKNTNLSASERLKMKKQGIVLPSSKESGEKVSTFTELANSILTSSGNMDIYQETFEQITDKVAASSSSAPVLDMYADDFDEKEKERLQDPPPTSSEPKSEPIDPVVKWEFKWKPDDEKIEGPHSTEQMAKWADSGYFKTGVMVRRCGTSQFYSSSRIDFELYL